MIDVSKVETDILFPNNEVVIGGQVFNVKPFVLGDVIKVSAKLSSILNLFDNNKLSPGIDKLEDYRLLLEKGGEDVLDIIALVFKKNRDWAYNLQLDDAVKAIAITIKVNQDFFLETVAPILDDVLPKERLQKQSLD